MSPYESGAALKRCTGLDPATFAESYWSATLLASHDSSGFADLLSPADIDELIAERGLRHPSFRLVKAGESITSLVDPDAVREHYATGSTLVLQSLHKFHPPLVRFCRWLAADLGHQTQCNAYVTPPRSQGFAPHHDTHDVFVLQIDGYKSWHIYAPALPLPLKSQPSKELPSDQLLPDGAPPLLSSVLGPGDALYLPRGFIHAAETSDDRSVHLTVGVSVTTAYDVLRDVLALAEGQPEFRQALPLGAPAEQLAPVAGIVARAALWMAALPAEQLHDAVGRRLSGTAVVEPLGMLAAEDQLRLLDKDTVVRPREGRAASVLPAPDNARIVLCLPDRELSLPEYVAPALAALLGGSCRLSDLDLPGDDALVLVRRLMQEGVLTV